MKRFLLSVFAVAALAIGWVGGNGIASTTDPNADTRRSAEIVVLSFPDDADIVRSWEKIQESRRAKQVENRGITLDNQKLETQIREKRSRLADLNQAIAASNAAIEEEGKIEKDENWRKGAGSLLEELAALEKRIKEYQWSHQADWEEIHAKLEPKQFGKLRFEDKKSFRDRAMNVHSNYLKELDKEHEAYSRQFGDLRNRIAIHLESLASPPP